MHPEAHTLHRVKWDYFCTLTLPDRFLAERARVLRNKTFVAWLREAARVLGVDFARLLWCLRSEHGEQGGRLHFHVLLAGKISCVTERNKWRLKHLWVRLSGAFADVRQFEAHLPGVAYFLKLEGVASANSYEVGKFSKSDDVVILSKSVARTLAARLSEVRLSDRRNALPPSPARYGRISRG